MFSTPVEAATSFATEFLGFEDPRVGDFQQGDSRSGEVAIRPSERGPVTTILVRQTGTGDDWSVLGAVTANIEVTGPAPGETIASPVPVTGRALAFEGNVQVEVRQDGQLGAIGEGFVTGGGDEMRGFTGSIAFETPTAPYGALVLFSTSPEHGQVWQAAAFRVALSPSAAEPASCGSHQPPRGQPGPGEMEVTVYFNCEAAEDDIAPLAVHRVSRQSPRVLEASLQALLGGPSAAERDSAFSSWFSDRTAGMLRSAAIEDGHAVVDFDADLASTIPNASTSFGSALLLSQLDATVFQFASVESVEYRLDGSCQAFSEWLQYVGCEHRTRQRVAD